MTIAEARRRVNHSLYLPAIQRPYVWKTDQIIGLFDSLMQGYPISSFLFWAIDPQNRRQWSIYRFEEAYRQGEPWDQKVEYAPEETECYMETVSGGLIKAGKKLILLKLLSGGKIEVTDGLVKVNIVPKSKAATFIEEFKKRKGKLQ